MQIGDVTISAALAWIIGAFGALAVIYKGVEIIKALFGKQRSKTEEALKKHGELLDNDNRRIKEMEGLIKEIQQDQKEARVSQGVMFRAMLSQINHTLTGNGDDKLRDARDEIQDYLTGR